MICCQTIETEILHFVGIYKQWLHVNIASFLIYQNADISELYNKVIYPKQEIVLATT